MSTIRPNWSTTQPPPRSPSRGRSGKRDETSFVHEALGTHVVDQTLRRRGIERQRHQRLPAAARARDGHVCDVDAGLTEERADPADYAWYVVVAEEDEHRRQLHLELEAERTDQPVAVVVADRRPRDAHLVAVRADDDAQQVREVAAGAPPFLQDVDTALRCDQGCIHVVDRGVCAALESAV